MTEYTLKKIGGKIDDRIVANPKDVEVAAYHQHNRNPSADDKTNYYNGEKELMEKRKEEIEGLSFQEEALAAPKKRAQKVSFAKKPKETKAVEEAPAKALSPTQKAPAGKTIEAPNGSYAKGPALGVRGTSKPYDGLKVASDTPKKEETPKGKVKTLVKENKRKNLRGCLTFLAATALIAAAVYGAHWLGTFNGKKAEDAQLKNKSNMEQVQGAEIAEVAKSGTTLSVQEDNQTTINIGKINNGTEIHVTNNNIAAPSEQTTAPDVSKAKKSPNVLGRISIDDETGMAIVETVGDDGKPITIKGKLVKEDQDSHICTARTGRLAGALIEQNNYRLETSNGYVNVRERRENGELVVFEVKGKGVTNNYTNVSALRARDGGR